MSKKATSGRRYFPLLISIAGKKCVVIGGGKVALRKVVTLLEYGAAVVVVAPEITREIKSLAARDRILLRQRKVKKNDLRGAALIFAGTNDREVNSRIACWAAELGIPVNVVDKPEFCSFIMPAILRRGTLQIAVSTEGEFPGLAQKVRDRIAEVIPASYEVFLKLLARYRRMIIAAALDEKTKQRLISSLREKEIYELFQRKGKRATEKALAKLLDKMV